MSDSDRSKGYLVECYWPGVSVEKLALTVERVRATVSVLRREGRDVDFVASILVPADETVFCLFEGVEADVRAASEQVRLPFERVLESLTIDGSQPGASEGG
jgi:hypothetical protein